jgi:O-antigen/teichoic acid export membrane protein
MVINRLKQILAGAYLRNVGWMAGAEIANRLIRLSSTVILARMFTPQDYGLMAVIYTLSDFFQVFTLRGGIGSKIIQADERDLNAICNTAYWLNWIVCGSLFTIQCAIAMLLPYFSVDRQITLLLCLLALTYLIYPLFIIHPILLERENQFKAVAICKVIITLISNVLTVTFVLRGMGIWAIVWAMLLSAPVWIILTRKFHPWRPPRRFSLERGREVLGFGGNLLINDLLAKVRANVDYLIVGKYLGVEALGLYYFAFNSGSGITLSILNTFMSPLYPHICAAKNNYEQFKQRYFSSLKKVSAILIPIILFQSALAPIYVPIIFGEKWNSAIPVLILICLSVIPAIYSWAASLLLNAINQTRISLYIGMTSTTIFIISILAVVENGIVLVAAAVFVNSLLAAAFAIFWTHRFALRNQNFVNAIEVIQQIK